MSLPRWGIAFVLFVGPICPPLYSDVHSAGKLDAAALAVRIDARVEVRLTAGKVSPSPLAGDAEFLRRVYLDLIGRIPRVSEARQFLDDRSADKRQRLVDSLLDNPRYAGHFANVWRALLVPGNNNQQFQFFAGQLDPWLRKRLSDNMPYNQMVHELLTSSTPAGQPNVARPFNGMGGNAAAFFQVNEFKPENLAAATSRLFLGIKLECAQCHDHPFAKWSRQQFWEFAAFFAGFEQGPPQAMFQLVPEKTDKIDLKIPGTEKTVKARFLVGGEPKLAKGGKGTTALADWLATGSNPFFARAAVNRLWGHFFGIGIVDPVDDLGGETPPSHPELLDDLSRAFVESAFDTKFLIRAITASKTYQTSSALGTATADQPRLFHRMALKGLTPEQLFDSLALATGFRENAPGNSQRGFNPFGTARNEFLSKFANASDKRTEYQTSILQALALMNGRFVGDATSLDKSETLAAVLDSPFLDWGQRLDTLFMATLSRPMRPEETSRLLPYVTDGGPSHDPRKATADVFWALLNSTEFFLNH